MNPYFVLFFLSLSFCSVAQVKPPAAPPPVEPVEREDTAGFEEIPDSVSVETEDEFADELNALYSAVIPGWGQVRNKQYTKAGIILGTFGFGLYNTINATNEYKPFADGYENRLLNFDDPIDEFVDIYTLDELYDLRQEHRSTKDIWTAATTYVYVGNLIDAAAQYKIIREEKEHSATKAAYYSALLPGLGQAYNKKYWKIPIVYAALGTSGYIAVQNRDLHRQYQRELEYRAIGETTGFRGLLPEDKLAENLEQWREWRDLAYIATGVVYALNVIDAAVDAHLYDFSVDDDLTFEASPVFDLMNGQPYYAVLFSVPINQ